MISKAWVTTEQIKVGLYKNLKLFCIRGHYQQLKG
jgi:hypothetical protein